jgi:hypothetical protein
VPLLGDFIAGMDKSGIFVSQFTVTGTSDDMKTAVNPVSSIAPGLLRDLFSPKLARSRRKTPVWRGRNCTSTSAIGRRKSGVIYR